MKTLRTLFKQDKEKFVVEMSGSRAVWKEVLAVSRRPQTRTIRRKWRQWTKPKRGF